MRNCRIATIITLLLAMGILLSSCYRTFNCPPYPENMTGFMPIKSAGGELAYRIGKDTCILKVGKLSLSKAYKYKSDCGGEHCEITAKQLLRMPDAYSISYNQQYERYAGETVKIDILIGDQGCQKDIGIWWVSYDFENKEHAREHEYEILPEYIAPTGKTYSLVLFYHHQDSVWISYNEGLVRYVPAKADTSALGQVWQLL